MCWWKVTFIGKKVIKDIYDAHSILLALVASTFCESITSVDEEICWWKVTFIGKKVIRDIYDAHSILLALVALGN
jgi:hypothetical protein